MKEIDALGESNYQLLAIGRNLNQVAKAMNEGRRDSVTIESIERLRGIIDTHTEKVSTAIRASVERWCIEKAERHIVQGGKMCARVADNQFDDRFHTGIMERFARQDRLFFQDFECDYATVAFPAGKRQPEG